MLSLSLPFDVLLFSEPIDLRKSYDGLAGPKSRAIHRLEVSIPFSHNAGEQAMLAVVDWGQYLMGSLMSITPTVLSGMLLAGLVWGAVASTRSAPDDAEDKPS